MLVLLHNSRLSQPPGLQLIKKIYYGAFRVKPLAFSHVVDDGIAAVFFV